MLSLWYCPLRCEKKRLLLFYCSTVLLFDFSTAKAPVPAARLCPARRPGPAPAPPARSRPAAAQLPGSLATATAGPVAAAGGAERRAEAGGAEAGGRRRPTPRPGMKPVPTPSQGATTSRGLAAEDGELLHFYDLDGEREQLVVRPGLRWYPPQGGGDGSKRGCQCPALQPQSRSGSLPVEECAVEDSQ